MKPLKNLSTIKFKQLGIFWSLSTGVGLFFAQGHLMFSLLLLAISYRFRRGATPMIVWSVVIVCYAVLRMPQELTIEDHQIDAQLATVKEVKKITEEKSTYVATINEVLYYVYDEDNPHVIPGDVLRITGQAVKPEPVTVPHAFDFKSYLLSQNISFVLYSDQSEFVQHQFSFWQYQYGLKKIVDEYYPPLVASYLNALILGLKGDLTPEFQESMTNLGLSHLMAISGLHVGIFCAAIYFLLKCCGVVVELIDWIIIIFLIVFIIITGASPSVVRASMMMILQLINRQFHLGYGLLDIFSIIFIGNVLVNPNQICDMGFIYSYTLTLFFIVCQNVLKNLSSIKQFFFIPFMAQLVSLPLQVYFNYEWTPFSLIANIIVVPLVSLFLLPLLLLTLFIPILASLTNEVLKWFEVGLITVATHFDFSIVYGQLSILLVALLFCLLVTGLYGFERYEKKWILLICGVSIFGCLEGNRLLMPNGKMTMLDVGQGDSFVIQSPYKKCTMVTDTGGAVKFGQPGASIYHKTLDPYLRGEGIRKIDFLILTHGDYDHVGEAKLLLESVRVNYLVINKVKHNDLMNEIIDLAKQVGTDVLYAENGDELTCGNIQLTFYHPSMKAESINDESLVYVLKMNGFRALFTGDISTKVEQQLLKGQVLPSVQLYKVAHHGSKSSNGETFIKNLNPELAFISAGRHNSYGHPNSSVVSTLQSQEVDVYNTQLMGSVELYIGRKHYWLEY